MKCHGMKSSRFSDDFQNHFYSTTTSKHHWNIHIINITTTINPSPLTLTYYEHHHNHYWGKIKKDFWWTHTVSIFISKTSSLPNMTRNGTKNRSHNNSHAEVRYRYPDGEMQPTFGRPKIVSPALPPNRVPPRPRYPCSVSTAIRTSVRIFLVFGHFVSFGFRRRWPCRLGYFN